MFEMYEVGLIWDIIHPFYTFLIKQKKIVALESFKLNDWTISRLTFKRDATVLSSIPGWEKRWSFFCCPSEPCDTTASFWRPPSWWWCRGCPPPRRRRQARDPSPHLRGCPADFAGRRGDSSDGRGSPETACFLRRIAKGGLLLENKLKCDELDDDDDTARMSNYRFAVNLIENCGPFTFVRKKGEKNVRLRWTNLPKGKCRHKEPSLFKTMKLSDMWVHFLRFSM